MQCQVLDPDWQGQTFTVGIPLVDVDPLGRALIYVIRENIADKYAMYVVADLDGTIRFALLQPITSSAPGCMLYLQAINDGRHILTAQGDDASDDGPSKFGGGIGGPIDELHPRVLYKNAEAGALAWRCSERWVAKYAPPFVLTVHPWDMSDEVVVTSTATDPQNPKVNQTVMHGDALFFQTSSLATSGLNVWDPVNGTRPFIRWLNDPTRAAANLGTDGVDLVWSEGSDQDPNTQVYQTRSVMTSPYTIDPASLAPRRLRSQPDDIQAIYHWEVSCGYGVFDGGSNNVMLVRISDGRGWFIPTTPSQRIYLHRGVTCNEVLAAGQVNGTFTLFRIRIDSLGPGLAPD